MSRYLYKQGCCPVRRQEWNFGSCSDILQISRISQCLVDWFGGKKGFCHLLVVVTLLRSFLYLSKSDFLLDLLERLKSTFLLISCARLLLSQGRLWRDGNLLWGTRSLIISWNQFCQLFHDVSTSPVIRDGQSVSSIRLLALLPVSMCVSPDYPFRMTLRLTCVFPLRL